MGIFSKSEEEKEKEAVNRLKEMKDQMKNADVLFDEKSDDELRKKIFQELYQIVFVDSHVRTLDKKNIFVMLGMSPQEMRHIAYLSTIVSQNMILILQNELLLRKFDKAINFLKDNNINQ